MSINQTKLLLPEDAQKILHAFGISEAQVKRVHGKIGGGVLMEVVFTPNEQQKEALAWLLSREELEYVSVRTTISVDRRM